MKHVTLFNDSCTTDQELKNVVDCESSSKTMTKNSKIRPMYFAALCSLLSAVTMGLAVGYSAPATYDMKSRVGSPVKPSESDVTWIGSMLALGAMIGGIFTGSLTDKIGRKDTLILNLIPFAGGWLLICYAKNVLTIMFGRFLCGLACGVTSVTVPMYCVEISTADVRGILGSAFQGFVTIGNLLSVIIGLYITWEQLALTGALFATFGVICFMPMPESPRWLLAKNELSSAISVMDKLQNGSIDAEEECKAIYKDLEGQSKGNLSLKECKCPSIYKPAIIAFTLMFFQQFSGANAVLFYSSNIFDVAKEFMNPKLSTVVLGIVQALATLLSNVIVDKAGRRILLILSGVFMALSLLTLGTYYYMSSIDPNFQSKFIWIPLASLILFIVAFSIGYGPIPWLLASEMVPVRARGTVSGVATFSNGLFAFIVTKTFSEIQDLIKSYGTFWFYSCLSILSVIFVIIMVPETKGKELEEIEEMFLKTKTRKADRVISISVIT